MTPGDSGERFSPLEAGAANPGVDSPSRPAQQPPRSLPPVKSMHPRVNPPKAPHGVSIAWNRVWVVVGVLGALLTTAVALLGGSWSVKGLFVWLLITILWVFLALYNQGQISRKQDDADPQGPARLRTVSRPEPGRFPNSHADPREALGNDAQRFPYGSIAYALPPRHVPDRQTLPAPQPAQLPPEPKDSSPGRFAPPPKAED